MLDWKGGHVADGVDARNVLDAAAIVDFQKTVGIVRKTGEMWAAEKRKRDYGVDLHPLASEQLEARR